MKDVSTIGRFYVATCEFQENHPEGGKEALQKILGENLYYNVGNKWFFNNGLIISMDDDDLNQLTESILQSINKK